MKIKPNIKKIENTNKVLLLLKQFFDFLYKKFTHWLITFYVSMFGSVMVFMENKSAIIWFLTILSIVLFLTAIVYGIMEIVKAVKVLIRKIINIVSMILNPLDRHAIEITLKVLIF